MHIEDARKLAYDADLDLVEVAPNAKPPVCKIDDHDYETKKSNVIRFLEKGSKVKVTIMFRGREQSRPELGTRLLDRLAEDVADYGIVESKPKQDGRNMTMVFGPVRKGKK